MLAYLYTIFVVALIAVKILQAEYSLQRSHVSLWKLWTFINIWEVVALPPVWVASVPLQGFTFAQLPKKLLDGFQCLFAGKTVAKAELQIPSLGLCGPWMEHDLELVGNGGPISSVLGHLDIALETKVMLKGELRQYLRLLGAKKQHEGFLMHILPVTEGEVVQEEAEDENPIALPADCCPGAGDPARGFRWAAIVRSLRFEPATHAAHDDARLKRRLRVRCPGGLPSAAPGDLTGREDRAKPRFQRSSSSFRSFEDYTDSTQVAELIVEPQSNNNTWTSADLAQSGPDQSRSGSPLSAMEKSRLVSAQDREDFMRYEVRPVLEDLAAAYWSTSPPPEDIVAFLINTLTVQYGLADPPGGALTEEAMSEMQDVEFRIKTLKKEVKEQLVSCRRPAAGRRKFHSDHACSLKVGLSLVQQVRSELYPKH
eukprot:s4188_g2.t1